MMQPRFNSEAEAIAILKKLEEDGQSDAHRQEQAAIKAMPSMFFSPNPWQYRAIRDMALGVKKDVQNVVGHFPANGVGKTYLAAMIALQVAAYKRAPNLFFNYPLFTDWPFPKHIRCIADKQLFMEGSGEFWKAIDIWWPKHLYTSEKGDYSYPSRYYIGDTVLDCITPEVRLRAHEGVELGMLMILEPTEEEVWNVYPRAFRHGGIKLLSCTLAHCSEWIDRRVMQDEKSIITIGNAMDNCDETVMDTPLGPVRGKLTRASLESMYAEYDKNDREARWNGTPLYWRGRALNGIWNPEVHVIDDDLCPPITLHKLNVDPHPAKPWALLVLGLDGEGRPWVVDEWPRFETFGSYYHEVTYDTPDHGEQFYFDLINSLRSQYRPSIPILDYKMANTPDRKDDGTSSLHKRLNSACHTEFTPQSCDVMGPGGGLALLKSALAYDRSKPVGAGNNSSIHILRRCRNTIYQLENLGFKKAGELGKFGSEVLDPKFLDLPRGIMSALSHSAGRCRIITPESEARRKAKIWRDELNQMRPHHPNWRHQLAHA